MDKMLYRIINNNKFYPYLKQFSRLYCQANVEPKISVCADNTSNLSTLFVPGRHGQDMYQIVKPVIDVKFINDNLNSLKFSCDHRGIHLDFENVLKLSDKWKSMRDDYSAIVEKSRENIAELTRSSIDGKKNETFQALNEKKNEFFEILGAERSKLYDIEDLVMPLFQKIPHTLHASTPLHFNVVDYCRDPSSSPGPDVRSHSHIARDMLHFTNDPVMYYMTGKLAILDLAIQHSFMDKLNSLDFSQLSCMNFCKSFIMEAIGYDPYSSIKIHEKDRMEIGQKLHLVGGASFEAFCAYLTNMNANKETLPMNYFSLGHSYNADGGKETTLGLFSTVQSTNIHYLVLSETPSDDSFDLLLNMIQNWYSEFNIPFRIVSIAAKNLTVAESRRKQLELWSPALRDYVPVAYISQHDDFVSKRLQITYGIQHIKEGYCHILEGAFVNVPVLIGCIVENFQTSNNDFTIPPVLEKFCF